MPPRLLPKSYGFIDTVHRGAVSSVWTTNKFCNQYAAMPSLHFGYSLIVGWSLFANARAGTRSRWRRMGLHYLFMGYPALILLAIVAQSLSSVLVVIALGLFLALGLDPVVQRLCRLGMRRGWATLITAVGFAGVVAGIVALVVPTWWQGDICYRICLVNPLTSAAMLSDLLDDMAAY